MAVTAQLIFIRRAMVGIIFMMWRSSKIGFAIRSRGGIVTRPLLSRGERHARRNRAYARQHRIGGSGATTQFVLPQRIRSVRSNKKVDNAVAQGK
jgi:hypothetical protein